MAQFRSAVITNSGMDLMGKILAGEEKLKFSKICISDQRYDEGQLAELTEISGIKQEQKISSVTVLNKTTVQVSADFSNKELESGYYVRTIGLYAENESQEDELYSVCIVNEEVSSPDYMPPYNGVGTSKVFINMVTAVGNAENVTIVIEETDGVSPATFESFKESTNKTIVEISGNLDKHSKSSIYSETGIHGLRYRDDKFQVNTGGGDGGGEWVDVESGSDELAPKDVTDLSVKVGDQKLTLFWGDPEDTIVEGHNFCAWAGTKVVAKEGGYPENVNDGVLWVDSKERNQYKTKGYEHSGLTNGTTYYIRLFPYSDKKAVNMTENNQITGTPQPFVVYGVEIDLSNSDPSQWAKYTDDAVGMEAGSENFDKISIFDIQSYTFKNGAEVKALSKTNNKQYADGGDASADLTSGEYDIMTKFKRGGYQITRSGTKLYVKVTDDPNKAGFCYKAFQRGSTDKTEFYLGRYKGSEVSGKLRSISGKAPVAEKTIGAFRDLAHANGAGYEQSGFYQLVWRQCLYMVKYLAANSQEKIGKGCVSGSAVIKTGGTDGRGDTWGDQDGKNSVILFGLEDFWGNIWEWIDGLVTDESYNILTNTDNFQDDGKGAGYLSTSSGLSKGESGYMTDVQGTNDTGFIFKKGSGSETTYFCDCGALSSGAVAYFGGNYSHGGYAGVCNLTLNNSASNSGAGVGGRVMFLKANED